MLSAQWSPSIPSVIAGLVSAQSAVGDFTGPLEASVAQVMAPSIDANFAGGGRPAWRPLSDLTVKMKGHSRMLEETGRLRDEVTSTLPWTIRDSTAVLVADVVGQYHMSGTRHMPARQFAAFQEADVNDIAEIFMDHAVNAIVSNVIVMR